MSDFNERIGLQNKKITMEKNGVYQGEVSALGTEGEGIINTEGATVFVPFCITGEKVRFKALKVKDSIAYGKLEKVLNAAYCRTNPPCKVFGKCGGCDLQHMDYTAQLNFKTMLVKNTLFKIGGITADVQPCVPCANALRYRNKLALPIGVIGEDTVAGFYGRHSHRIVPISDCLIQSEWVKNVIAAVEKYAKVKHIRGYNEQTRCGVLRKIVVREIKGRFIFALVAAKPVDVQYLIEELEKNFEDFTFLLNINSSEGNAIFGKEWRICRGDGFFEAEEGGVLYKAGANTFLQVNDEMRLKLYAEVLKEISANSVAIDLYSGGGMLTAMLAKKCKSAYGVEIIEEASRCADELKNANGLQGKMFNVCGAVEDKIDEIFAATEGEERIIICDPPRKGMERSVVRAIAKSGADKVVLISCNPSTLARDAGLLCGTLEDINGALFKMGNSDGAYEIVSVTPFDMFPQTKHVETLVVLKKKR